MFRELHDLLTTEEIRWLNEEVKHFRLDLFQLYNVQTIGTNELLNYKNKVAEYLNSNFSERFILQSSWINRIDQSDADMDDYHLDSSDMTVVTYFNTDFTGGDFEYVYNNVPISVSPRVNLSLLMNNELKHRVTKVETGTRYSLASFYKLDNANKKRLL